MTLAVSDSRLIPNKTCTVLAGLFQAVLPTNPFTVQVQVNKTNSPLDDQKVYKTSCQLNQDIIVDDVMCRQTEHCGAQL